MASHSYVLLGPEHWNKNHLAKLDLSSCLAKTQICQGVIAFLCPQWANNDQTQWLKNWTCCSAEPLRLRCAGNFHASGSPPSRWQTKSCRMLCFSMIMSRADFDEIRQMSGPDWIIFPYFPMLLRISRSLGNSTFSNHLPITFQWFSMFRTMTHGFLCGILPRHGLWKVGLVGPDAEHGTTLPLKMPCTMMNCV